MLRTTKLIMYYQMFHIHWAFKQFLEWEIFLNCIFTNALTKCNRFLFLFISVNRYRLFIIAICSYILMFQRNRLKIFRLNNLHKIHLHSHYSLHSHNQNYLQCWKYFRFVISNIKMELRIDRRVYNMKKRRVVFILQPSWSWV